MIIKLSLYYMFSDQQYLLERNIKDVTHRPILIKSYKSNLCKAFWSFKCILALYDYSSNIIKSWKENWN